VTLDLELATEARQLVVGLCADCDRTQNVTRTGECSVCGSNSIVTRGAVKEFRRLGALQAKETGEDMTWTI